jgi:hypothetical protein
MLCDYFVLQLYRGNNLLTNIKKNEIGYESSNNDHYNSIDNRNDSQTKFTPIYPIHVLMSVVIIFFSLFYYKDLSVYNFTHKNTFHRLIPSTFNIPLTEKIAFYLTPILNKLRLAENSNTMYINSFFSDVFFQVIIPLVIWGHYLNFIQNLNSKVHKFSGRIFTPKNYRASARNIKLSNTYF